MTQPLHSPLFAAAISIVLWASLASLVAALPTLPPFLLTGLGLLLGSAFLLPWWRQWRLPWPVFWLGSVALFAFHAALFTAFKMVPVVTANLINYLWPLFIVVLAPLFDRQQTLTSQTVLATLLGFAGAALAIVGDQTLQFEWSALGGYGLALLAALIWSSYTLLLKRLPPFASPAVGAFSLMAGAASLSLSAGVETWPELTTQQMLLLLLIAAGPLGFAFYFWDRAAKTLPGKTLGVLSFVTPVLSTTLLIISTGKSISPHLLLSATLVLAAIALVVFQRR